MEYETRAERPGKVELAVLAAIVIAASVIRFWGADRSLWEDEVYQYDKGANVSFWRSISYQTYPLYHILSFLTIRIADSEWALRLPSILAGILGVVLIYLLGRRAIGPSAGLTAAFLLAFSEFHAWHSREARFYALMMLTGLAAIFVLEMAVRSGRRRDWILFVVAGNLAVMTQIMAAPILAAGVAGAGLWILFSRAFPHRQNRARRMGHLVLCSVLAVTGLAAGAGLRTVERGDATTWTVSLNKSSENKAQNRAQSSDIATLRARTYDLTPREYLEMYPKFFQSVATPVQAVFLAFGVIGLVGLWKLAPAMFGILGATIFLSPIPFFLVSVSHWYHPRYFSTQLPVAVLCIACGVAVCARLFAFAVARLTSDRENESALRRTWMSAPVMVAVGCVAIVAILFPAYFRPLRGQLSGQGVAAANPGTPNVHAFKDFKGAAHYVRRHAEPFDLFLLYSMQDHRGVRRGRYECEFYAEHVIYPYLRAIPPDNTEIGVWYISAADRWPARNLLPPGILKGGNDAPVARFSNTAVYRGVVRTGRVVRFMPAPFHDGFGKLLWSSYAHRGAAEATLEADFENPERSVLTVTSLEGPLSWVSNAPPMPIEPNCLVFVDWTMSGSAKWSSFVGIEFFDKNGKKVSESFWSARMGEALPGPGFNGRVRALAWSPADASQFRISARIGGIDWRGTRAGDSYSFHFPAVYVDLPPDAVDKYANLQMVDIAGLSGSG